MPLIGAPRLAVRIGALLAPFAWIAHASASSPFGPFGAGLPEDGFSSVAAFPRLFIWTIEVQTYFNAHLTSALQALKHDSSAAWTLMGVSLLYGIVHAIGPGHGKAVISSYVLASRQTVRNGIALAFLSAFAQAIGAIALILVASTILRLTSVAITLVTYRFEIGSDLLIILLGFWLVYSKAVSRLIARSRAVCPSGFEPALASGITSRFEASAVDPPSLRPPAARASQPPLNACQCGSLHMPEPQSASGGLDWRKTLGIAAVTALRPCTGALIVLVFSRVEGVFLMGVLAVFAMGFGVAITVSALAVAAASLRGASFHFFDSKWLGASWIKVAVEVAASLAILAFGVLMLAANLSLG